MNLTKKIVKMCILTVFFIIIPLFLLFAILRMPLPSGLIASYYDNPNWSGKPVFIQHERQINLTTYEEAKAQLQLPSTNFSITWEGWIRIDEYSDYHVTTVSDDGSSVFIDDTLIVDNGGFHGVKQEESEIFLTKGMHKITINYFNGPGTYDFSFQIARDRQKEPDQPLSPDILFPHALSKDMEIFTRHPRVPYLGVFISLCLGILIWKHDKRILEIWSKALSRLTTELKHTMKQQLQFSRREVVFLIGILMLSLCLNLVNNNFSFKYHSDEPIKVRAIRRHTQNFKHPILMLQVVRLANLFLRYSKGQDIAVLGRITTAFWGSFLIFFSYLIFRNLIKPPYALVAALATALSPIIVVHSHYFKEDMILTYFCYLSLFCLFKFIESPHQRPVLLLGLATGLALSSHYKANLLVFFYFMVPFLIPSIKKFDYYKHLGFSLVISLVTFLTINYPVLLDFETFKKGVMFEIDHSIEGHTLILPGTAHFFSFHLLHSIIPGITILPTLLAIGFMLYSLFRWKTTLWQDRALILYVCLFYFAVELLPLKPWPGFIRYVIPIIPCLLYFAYKALLTLSDTLPKAKWMIAGLLVLSLLSPSYETAQLVYYLNKDTRSKVDTWRKSISQRVIAEKYSSSSWYRDIFSLAELDILQEKTWDVTYLVASELMYGRYVFGNTLKNQPKAVYERYNRYQELFKYPFIEIKPAYKTYAFSNPTIRIIDVRKEQTAVFRLTKDSMKQLRGAGIPEKVVNALKPLQWLPFIKQEDFLETVKKHIGEEQTFKYQEQILKHAQQPGPDRE